MDFPWISKGLPSTTQYYDLLKKLAFWIEIMKNVLIRFANRFVWSDERRYAGQTEIWKFWKIWNFWNFFFVELFRTYYDFLQDFENYGHLKKYRLFEKKKKASWMCERRRMFLNFASSGFSKFVNLLFAKIRNLGHVRKRQINTINLMKPARKCSVKQTWKPKSLLRSAMGLFWVICQICFVVAHCLETCLNIYKQNRSWFGMLFFFRCLRQIFPDTPFYWATCLKNGFCLEKLPAKQQRSKHRIYIEKTGYT